MVVQSNREYLTKTLSRFSLTEDDIDLTSAEHPGLEGANFNVLMYKNAICKSMSEILPAANISESSFSLSWNMDALEMWYNALCKELGRGDISGGRPKARNRSNSWQHNTIVFCLYKSLGIERAINEMKGEIGSTIPQLRDLIQCVVGK